MERSREASAAVRRSAEYVLSNARLRRVTAVWGLWIVGEWAVVVVITIAGFELGGTTAVAVLAIVRTLPPGIAAPVLGTLADRLPRPMVVTAVSGSWVVLVAAAALTLHANSLPWLYVVVCVAGIASTMLRPGINGLLPQVVETAVELAAANSAYCLVEAVGSLIGPILAGLLVLAAAPEVALLWIAALFLVGAIAAATISTDFQPTTEQPKSWRRAFLRPVAGFAALTHGRQMRALFALFMAQTFTRGLLNVFFVVIAVNVLHEGVNSTSALIAALGAGGVIGSVLTFAASGRRAGPMVILGTALWGVPLVLIALAPYAAATWFALSLIGMGNAIGDVFGFTLMQRHIPDHLLGRAFGAFWGGVAVMQAIGAVCAPALITAFGMRGALFAGGAIMLTCVALTSTAGRTAGEEAAADPDTLAALQRCELLTPLTRIALEQLAGAATTVKLPAGTTVIAEGTVEDSLYVVVEGTLSASVQGRLLSTMGAGDCFGEIAALLRVPRTASVRAATDSTALKLDGPTFARAVTTHRLATDVASALTSDRLRNTSPAAEPTSTKLRAIQQTPAPEAE